MCIVQAIALGPQRFANGDVGCGQRGLPLRCIHQLALRFGDDIDRTLPHSQIDDAKADTACVRGGVLEGEGVGTRLEVGSRDGEPHGAKATADAAIFLLGRHHFHGGVANHRATAAVALESNRWAAVDAQSGFNFGRVSVQRAVVVAAGVAAQVNLSNAIRALQIEGDGF